MSQHLLHWPQFPGCLHFDVSKISTHYWLSLPIFVRKFSQRNSLLLTDGLDFNNGVVQFYAKRDLWRFDMHQKRFRPLLCPGKTHDTLVP